jgi:D-ribose pyranase
LKKTGILNQDISRVIAGMGHTDMLVIADAGLPIPASTERIDLALCQGLPGLLSTVKVIVNELKVEKIILAEEIKAANPELCESLVDLFDDVEVDFVVHEDFKVQTSHARAIVRTGEFSPYANVILVSGVIF